MISTGSVQNMSVSGQAGGAPITQAMRGPDDHSSVNQSVILGPYWWVWVTRDQTGSDLRPDKPIVSDVVDLFRACTSI